MGKEAALRRILQAELRLHPRMAALDLQKLVYHTVFGMDHLLAHPHHFERDLRLEWQRLEPGADVAPPALQVVDPDGRTARLHLGPCRTGGVPIEELVAILESQTAKNGAREEFDRLWALVCSLAREGKIPFAEADMVALPYPTHPPHHSPDYGPAAYRIINDVTHPETADWIRRRLV